MAAETPSSPPSSPPPPPPTSTAASQYWCYHCDKRVSVETQPGQPDDAIICIECKFGFVESIQLTTSPSILSPPSDHHHHSHLFGGGVGGGGGFPDEPTLGNQFLQVLRLLAQVAREDDAPPPPPPPPQPRPLNPEDPSPSDESDFLRIEIDGWDEDDENENENENGNENHNHHHNNNNRNNNINNDIFINNNGDDDVEVEQEEEEDDDDEEDDEDDDDDVRSVEIVEQSDEDEDEREEDIRRRRRDVLRLRLRDFANRARSEGRNRILDWAEILMGLEDNSIEFRFELPEATDRYIGNPGDYVDAAEYEALLQNLADAEGRRGAPPASKAAVEGLKAVEIKTVEESYVCAICKDGVNVGDTVKEMPCGHGYHGDCIVPWLASRNSCPVCRFELPTEDADYEEERKKKFPGGSSSGSSAGNSV